MFVPGEPKRYPAQLNAMPDTNEQSDDFDDMLRELKDNWDLISSQLMSDQLPTTSFAMSSLDDFQALLAESTGKMERLLHEKQKTAVGLQNTILPMRDKLYFRELATSIGCVYVLAVLAKRWDEIESLPPSMEDR